MPFYQDSRKGNIRAGYLYGTPHGELVAEGRDNGVIPVQNFVNTVASTAISGTASETLFDQNYTPPADFFRSGSRIRIKAQGIVTANGNNATLAIKLYFGGTAGTALAALTARTVSANDFFVIDSDVLIRTAGTAGTFVATTLAPANVNVPGTTLTQVTPTGSTAVDTTQALQIAASATWSVASTTNSVRLDVLSVEIA